MGARILNIIGIGIITIAAVMALLIVGTISWGYAYDKAHPPAGKAVAAFDGKAKFYDNVRYCAGDNAAQEYDLYVPAEHDGPVPLVVHVHGGGWRWGDKASGVVEHYAQPLVEKGIAFASIDYRLADQAVYPAQNQDVECAVEHLQEHARIYGINGRSVIMMGDSAGGHLAALEGLDATNDHVKAVVMLYGVSDLWKQITEYSDVNALHYLGEKSEFLAKKASPAYQALWDAPPFLLVHGTADSIVPASESADFMQDLANAGREATYIPIEGAEHGFIDNDPAHEEQARTNVLNFIYQQFGI